MTDQNSLGFFSLICSESGPIMSVGQKLKCDYKFSSNFLHWMMSLRTLPLNWEKWRLSLFWFCSKHALVIYEQSRNNLQYIRIHQTL